MSRNDSGRWRDVGGAVWWRQLRSDHRADVMIAVVVAITAFLVGAAPGVLERASSRDLSATISTATPEERNLRFQARTEIGAGSPDEPLLDVGRRGEQLRDEHIPPTVMRVIAAERWVVDSPSFVVSSFPDEERGTFSRTFRFRYQAGIDDHARLVSGTAPRARPPIAQLEGSDCPDVTAEQFESTEGQDCAIAMVPVFETAITRQTSDDMKVGVGDMLTLRPSATDLAFRTAHVDAGQLRFALRISGIVELDDQALDYWYGDTSLHRPRITETADFRLVIAVGLVSPDQFRVFAAAALGVTLDVAWRYLVDPKLVGRADAEQLRDDVTKISAPDADLLTLLPDLLGAHLAQRRLATALLSVSALGLTLAALSSIWVLSAVDGVRRRTVLDLLDGRGASRAQLALHAARTAALVAVPAAVLGSAAAWVSFPDTEPRASLVGAVLVASAAFASVVVAGTPRRPPADRSGRRLRRIVAEILVVAVAIGAMTLLDRRESSVVDAVGRDVDPTLVLAPALVALAFAIVAFRAIGPLANVIAWVAERRRTASWFVGARGLVSQPVALRVPIVAIAMAAAAASFATVVSTSLDRHRELASWQAVGGEARVETTNPDVPLPERLQAHLSRRTGSPAFGATLPSVRIDGPSGEFVSDVVALDTRAFRAIIDEGALADAVDVPIDFLLEGDEPLPALIVGGPAGGSSPRAGDVVELQNGSSAVALDLRAATDQFPGIAIGRPTILVERAALAEATGVRTIAPTFSLLGGEGLLDAEVRSILDDPRVLVRWTERADHLAAMDADPLSAWTKRTAWLLVLFAVSLTVVAAAAGTVITATTRRRDLGVLTILGLERREAVRLVAIELVPGVVVAATAGVISGAGTAHLLGPNLDLEVFAGGGRAADVVFAWAVLVGLAVVLVASTGAAVGVTVRSLRRVDHAMLVRRGDV